MKHPRDILSEIQELINKSDELITNLEEIEARIKGDILEVNLNSLEKKALDSINITYDRLYDDISVNHDLIENLRNLFDRNSI